MRMSFLVPPRAASETSLARHDRQRGVRLDRDPPSGPWIPLFIPKQVDFLSKRVGNSQYSPSGLGMLIVGLRVR
jgi:hypothetical protein